MSAAARRRAWSVPSLPSVMSRSPQRFSSFAFASVVRTASCSRSAVTRLRNSARRCAAVRLSFTPATRWRMTSGRLFLALEPAAVELFPGGEVLEPDAERQAHLVQDVLDLVEGLPAEVLGLQHLLL